MIKKALVFQMIILISFAFNASAAERLYGDAQISKVIKVYDGDTFYADIDGWPDIVGDRIGIRIAGIDTPEIRTKCESEKQLARTARRLAENLLKHAEIIEIRNIRRGKYFRIVADVFIDGQNLADLMIKNGLAKPYDGGHKHSWRAE